MLQHEYSPLASTLIETPPTSFRDLFGLLEEYSNDPSGSKLQIGAVQGEKNSLAELISGGNFTEKYEHLHRYLNLADGGAFLHLWSTLDSLDAAYSARLIIDGMSALDETSIEAMVTEMERVPDLPDRIDYKYLVSGVKLFVEEIRSGAERWTSRELSFYFLRSLVFNVMGRVQATSNFWEILLLKLESRFLPSGSYPEMSPFFAPFRIANANIINQPALFEFCLLSEEIKDAKEAASNVSALAFISHAPTHYRRDLYTFLDAEFFYSLEISGPFSEKSAPWRTALYNRLERSFADLFVEATDRSIILRENLEVLISESKTRDSISSSIASDLSQGMKGQNVSARISDNCSRLMNAAACSFLLSSNFIEAKELFIPVVISELGISPRVDIWRKHSQLLSGLAEATREMQSSLNWVEISKLFTALDKRVSSMQARPLKWIVADADKFPAELGLAEEQNTLLLRVVDLTAARIAIDERLYGNRWKQTIKQWLARELFVGSAPLDGDIFEQVLSYFFGAPSLIEVEGSVVDEEYLKKRSRHFSSSVARVAAASALFRKAEDIGECVADQVLFDLPEYAEKIGEAGRLSCKADNRITLLKVAELLLASDEDPTEKLSEWWTSLVGSYLANRPTALFETNLNAIYRNISAALPPAQTDMAFAPIQAMYNDSLGVSCIEAMASRPLNPIGGLVDSAPRADEAIQRLLASDVADFSTLNVQGLEPQVQDKLLGLFGKFHKSLWSDGSADIAAGRVLPELMKITPTAACSNFGSEVLSAAESLGGSKAASLVKQSAHAFSDLLIRFRISAMIEEQATEIANYYSEAMVSYAPEYFQHLDRNAAISKCSRDQKLLYGKIATYFKSSTPLLAWFDLTRYFLELQSPFVNYPERIWQISFRTLSKVMGKYLSASENYVLVRLISRGEALASVWSKTQVLAKNLFDPRDYVFSARADTDVVCRDLVTAIIVADGFGQLNEHARLEFLTRFYVSSKLSSLESSELESIVSTVRDHASDFLSSAQLTTLNGVVEQIARIKDAYSSSNSSIEALSGFDRAAAQMKHFLSSQGDGSSIESDSTAENALLSIIQRVSSSVSAAASTAVLNQELEFDSIYAETSLRYMVAGEDLPDFDAGTLSSTVLAIVSGGSSEDLSFNRARSALHLTQCVRESASVLFGKTGAAGEFLSRLEAGELVPFNPGDAYCQKTTQGSFDYTFKTAAVASLLPSVDAPRLFFGRGSENQKYFDISVSANAHAQTCMQVAEILPSSSVCGFDVVGDRIGTGGFLWNKVAFSNDPIVDDVLRLLGRSALEALFESAPSSAREALVDLMVLYIGELSLHGDWEFALQKAGPAINSTLADHDASILVEAIFDAASKLNSSLELGASLFWKIQFGLVSKFIEQVNLGQVLGEYATVAAEAYVRTKYKDSSDLDAKRCYRDQIYLLKMLSASMANLGPSAALLNPSKSHVDYVVAHLKNSSLDLAENWVFYEAWFSTKLSGSLKGSALEIFGQLGQVYARSIRIRNFVADSLDLVSQELAEKFNLGTYMVRDFLAGLCACSMVEGGPGANDALSYLERLLLGSRIPEALSEEDYDGFVTSVEVAFDGVSNGSVPNFLKRMAIELPQALQRVKDAAAASGSSMARFFVANANSSLVAPMWKSTNFARCSLEDRSIEPEKNDAAVSRALGIPLPDDDDIVKELVGYKRLVASLGDVQLVIEKKGLLGGLFDKGPKTNVDWQNSKTMRSGLELSYLLVSTNALLGITGRDFAAFHKVQSANSDFLDVVAVEQLSSAFHNGLVNNVGEDHGLAKALKEYFEAISEYVTAGKLLEFGDSFGHFYGLHLAGHRTGDHGLAYFRGSDPVAALEKLIDGDGTVAAEKVSNRLRATANSIKQSLS